MPNIPQDFPFRMVAGTSLEARLDARCWGLYVSNYTAQWVEIADANEFVPPNTRQVISLPGSLVAKAQFASPPGVVQPVAIATQAAILTYTEREVQPSGGVVGATALAAVTQIERFAKANIPAAGTTGRLIQLTDYDRGIWKDTGSQFVSIEGETFNVKQFGAKGDGIRDDSVEIQAAYTQAAIQGGRILYPPGSYKVTVSPVLSAAGSSQQRVLIEGYGAQIIPVGAIWGHTVQDTGAWDNPATIMGLTVTCETPQTAACIGGFLGEHTGQLHYIDCNFIGDSIAGVAGFIAAFAARNKTAATPGTASLWTRFTHPRIRNQTLATKMAAGILLGEDANASIVSGGMIQHCTDAILVNSRNATLQLNHLLVDGVDLENNTNGVVLDGEGPSGQGVRVRSCRGELLTNFFLVRNRTIDFGGAGAPYGAPPLLSGNFPTSTVTNYIGALAAGITVLTDDGENRQFGPIGLFALNSTTPSALNLSYVSTNSAIATSITNITGGRPGQLLVILANDGATTLVHAAGGVGQIRVASGANQLLTGSASYLFIYDGPNSRWSQIRTTN